ncbi:hypothetical protein XI01_03280 [Bradyrhizobium sp. CCBAU 21360]|nr:hypothetical protein [Bradyrhizobium sp. CCBAU 21360]
MTFHIWRSFESDRFRPTEDLKMRLYLSCPAIDDEAINVLRIETVLRQSGNDCIEIVDDLVSGIVPTFLLLGAEDQLSVLDKSDRPVVRQFDAANTHSSSMSNLTLQ